MQRRGFLTSALAATAAWAPSARARTSTSYYPDVVLQTHEGKTVRFYEDLLKNRVVVMNFMFTGCGDICPSMTQNLVEVQSILSDRVGLSIFMYSFTLQPELDTPEILSNYAAAFGVRPGWLFLTGAPTDMEVLRRRLGFADTDPVLDVDKAEHIGVVRFGNDALDRWAACPALTEPEEIAREILWLAPKV